MKYKDFYQHLTESTQPVWDSSKLISYLMENKVNSYSGILYHGTPKDGLLSMLKEGLWGTQHGEISEYNTLSTSINENVLNLFADHDKGTGVEFTVKDKKILVLDEILSHLATRSGGSGIEFDFDEDEYEEFCREYSIPKNNRDYYLPYNFFSDMGTVDCIVYDYTWKMIHGRGYQGGNDETEICFVGNGIDKINKDITGIYIDWDEYDITEKQEAINRLESDSD